MGYNKVIVNGVTKVDLTSDTVSPDTMLEGVVAHNSSGDEIIGNIPINPNLEVDDGQKVTIKKGYYSDDTEVGYFLPVPTIEDAHKVVRANSEGTGYELVDISEIDVPVGIIDTVTGNPATLSASMEGYRLFGLKIYGKTTQSSTPNGSYVELVSPGTSGNITITVSNGSDENQQLISSTQNSGLYGIPVNSGGNFSFSNQQYACNIRDYGAGLDTIAVGRIVLDGTEEWIIQSGKFGAVLKEIALPNINMYDKNGLCSHFDYATENNRYNGIYVYNVENVGIIALGPPLTNQYGSNVETWKTFLQTQSSQGHPVEVLYRLAEPYTQAIPEEEMQKYRGITTYDNLTVVSTSEPINSMEVKYLANTKKYIDNQVSNAIILAQGGVI